MDASVLSVQKYYGRKECQVSLSFSVGGFAGSLPQIFPFLQNLGIPSRSQTSHLPYLPLCPQ